MAKGYTLDTRTSLYGEPRLSDAQVRMLRDLRAGKRMVLENNTYRSLRRTLLVEFGGSRDHALISARITDRGRKILAAIDAVEGAGGAS